MSVQNRPSQLIWVSLCLRRLCHPLPPSRHVPLLLRMLILVLAYVSVNSPVVPPIDPILSRLCHLQRVSSGGLHLQSPSRRNKLRPQCHNLISLLRTQLALGKFPRQKEANLGVLVAVQHLDNLFLLISLRTVRDIVLAQFHALQPRQYHQTMLYSPPLVSVSASECRWLSSLSQSLGF